MRAQNTFNIILVFWKVWWILRFVREKKKLYKCFPDVTELLSPKPCGQGWWGGNTGNLLWTPSKQVPHPASIHTTRPWPSPSTFLTRTLSICFQFLWKTGNWVEECKMAMNLSNFNTKGPIVNRCMQNRIDISCCYCRNKWEKEELPCMCSVHTGMLFLAPQVDMHTHVSM